MHVINGGSTITTLYDFINAYKIDCSMHFSIGMHTKSRTERLSAAAARLWASFLKLF